MNAAPSPSRPGREQHSTEWTLSWGECDPAGIIYYATYLHWSERLHSEWWLSQGHHLSTMRANWGAAFAIRHVSVDYLVSPLPLERVRGAMTISKIGRTSFTVEFPFTRPTGGEVLAVQRSVAVFVSPEGGSAPIPERARHVLERAVRDRGADLG